MTKLQAIRTFASTVMNRKVAIASQRMEGTNWSMIISGNTITLCIPQSFTVPFDEDDKKFRADFIRRYNPARGFSHTTLVILHELGHWATRFDFSWEDDEELRELAYDMDRYLLLPSEQLATDWAIDWLKDPEHRKLAKQFEKQFFGH